MALGGILMFVEPLSGSLLLFAAALPDLTICAGYYLDVGR